MSSTIRYVSVFACVCACACVCVCVCKYRSNVILFVLLLLLLKHRRYVVRVWVFFAVSTLSLKTFAFFFFSLSLPPLLFLFLLQWCMYIFHNTTRIHSTPVFIGPVTRRSTKNIFNSTSTAQQRCLKNATSSLFGVWSLRKIMKGWRNITSSWILTSRNIWRNTNWHNCYGNVSNRRRGRMGAKEKKKDDSDDDDEEEGCM